MYNKNWKRMLGILIMLFALTVISGCSKQSEAVFETEDEKTEIPVVFLIDPVTNLSNNKDFVDDFNQLQDQYYVNVQWLTESTAGYRDKLKQWNVLDQMPAVITDAGFDYDFYRLLVDNKRLVDLRPYMEQDEQWRTVLNSSMIKECMEQNGCIYLSPLGSPIQSYAGILYNKEMLKKAGYDEFPETWEAFWDCLDKLEEQNFIPLSLHALGSYWVPMLFATSYLYSSSEGAEFLDTDYPVSYRNESMSRMMEMFRRLYRFSYSDAQEIDYSTAAQRFLDGEAAIFANGYWMILDMPENVKDQFGFAAFPNQIVMNSPRMSGWAITANYDEKVIAGAAELLKYRISCDLENTSNLMNEVNIDSLQKSYIEHVQKADKIMPNYQMKWEQEIQNDFFSEYLPVFLDGEMSTDEFLDLMDKRLQDIRMRK